MASSLTPPTSSPRRVLVTGATGLLGSHVVERFQDAGHTLRALVRRSSNTAWLKSRGIELVRGELTDLCDCATALAGIDWVVHCASKVGDWGTWSEFERDSILATQTLATSAARSGVERFLHCSSTSAYGHPRTDSSTLVDESFPLGAHLWTIWDDYTRSKVEQERVLWKLVESSGLRLSIIRPSWLYGERDRTTTARIVKKTLRRGVPIIGRGDNPLSAVYAGVVADAFLLAATNPLAVNQAYNITDQGPITQREFFRLWADALGRPPTRTRFWYWAVYAAALGFEAWGRLTRSKTPPLITRYATWLMGRPTRYCTAKAQSDLGWSPRISYEQAIRRTVEWYLNLSNQHA